MYQALMGLETEYALACLANGQTMPHELGVELIAAARRTLPHLRSAGGGGIFLANGARLYLDTGGHPELATPEVDNPDDCVRYAMAGDAIVGDLLADLGVSRPIAREAVLYKCNVDYVRPGTTWAAHESYLHRCKPAVLPDQLIPHLVARVIFGAGGLDPKCPGIRLSLSPRAHLFVTDVSDCSTSTRGIYNTRDEPLAPNGHHRLHVICGDSLCSHVALWLKVATTSMVVMLADAGLEPGRGVTLKHPVRALHGFAGDPTLSATAQTTEGRTLTAVQIQRHYLEQAETHVTHLPDWAPEACRRWGDMLDRLELAPGAAGGHLDWATKIALFEDRIRRRGLDPATLPQWNQAARSLLAMLRRGRTAVCLSSAEFARHFSKPEPQVAARLDAHGLDWNRFPDFLETREELCEIDVRYTQVQPRGLFSALEGELDHRVPGVNGIDEARETPPAGTRAALRGRLVRRFSGRARFEASWEFVSDAKGRYLDLSDPFGRDAKWSRHSVDARRRRRRPPMPPRDDLSAAYNTGNFHQVHDLLRTVVALPLRLGLEPRISGLLPYEAWTFAQCGRVADAVATLDRLAGILGDGASLAPDYVAVHRFQSLVPHDDALWRWMERADALADAGRLDGAALASYLGHKGWAQSRCGDLDEAERTLLRSCATGLLPLRRRRPVARNHCDLADVLRQQGRAAEAAEWLHRAGAIFRQGQFTGEHADRYLLTRARLEHRENPDGARRLLQRARIVQKRLGRPLGLMRTLLLEARLAPSPITARRRHVSTLGLRDETPDLATCPRLAMILERWDEWTGDLDSRVDGDVFWLV